MGFRENLREALEYSGLEQKELAYKAKTSLRGIQSYLKKNGSIPTAEKAVRIAQALGVTVEYLVTGKELPQEASAGTEPEIKKLVQNIKKLPKSKQYIIIQNAHNLVGILLEKTT